MRCPECGWKRGKLKKARDIDNGTELNYVLRYYTCQRCKTNFETSESWFPHGMDPSTGEYVEETGHHE